MSDNLHNEQEFVHEQYEQMIRAHQNDETILVSHFGELSQSVISNLEGSVEEKITSLDIAICIKILSKYISVYNILMYSFLQLNQKKMHFF